MDKTEPNAVTKSEKKGEGAFSVKTFFKDILHGVFCITYFIFPNCNDKPQNL